MAADFPSSVHTFTVVTDGVTYWTKALIEERDDEVAALETYLISTTRTENTLFAGPTTAPAAAPTWRALVAADLPAATTTAQGAVELATSAETQTGTDTDRAVTPAGLRSDIPAAPAASRGVRLDASGHLVMPDDGRAEFTALAGTLSVLFDMYSDTVTHRWEASFRKSHQDTEGNTATIDTDILGGVSWYGNDGSGFTSAAAILVEQDGAASTYTPAAIVFLVADGTNAPAEVGRFSKDGYFGAGTATPAGVFEASGSTPSYFSREAAGVQTVIVARNPHTATDGDGVRVAFQSGGINVSGIMGLYDGGTANANKHLDFYTGGLTQQVRVTGDGDVLLGTTTSPSANSGKVLVFGDNAADPTMDTDTAGIYAKDDSGVEMFAIDEADNAAQLTPHNFSGPVQPIAGTLHWSQYHRNRYLGVEKWYDMERALLALEALTGQTFIHTQQLPFNERLNWEQEQVKRLRAAMARGESYKVKPRPSWM